MEESTTEVGYVLNENLAELIPKQINPEVAIICMSLKFQGFEYWKIGKIVNRAETTIRGYFCKSGALYTAYQLFKKNMIANQITPIDREEINQALLTEAKPSIETAKQIRDNPLAKSGTRLMAAFGLIDRAGFSPIQRQAILQANVTMNDKDLSASFEQCLGIIEQRIKSEQSGKQSNQGTVEAEIVNSSNET